MAAPDAELSFDLTRIGLETSSQAMRVSMDAIRLFADATNDANERYRTGQLAPPVYAMVPVLPVMVAAKNAVTRAFAFHGEHEFFFHQPLRSDETFRATSRVIGVHQRSAGVATTVEIETTTTRGELLNRQYFASFVAGGRVERNAGEDAPGHVPPQPGGDVAEITYALDPDQTLRFAAATNDWDEYTLDDDFARSMGFPAKIVHGPCTLAFIGRALVNEACQGDPQRLKRLAVRFARPLVLTEGQTITTRFWPFGQAGGRVQYGFVATDKEGVMIAKNGWAEVEHE